MPEWRAIPGFDGMYEVSDEGEVRTWRILGGSKPTRILEPRTLKTPAGKKGYRRVGLWKGNQVHTRLLHRLVLSVFVGPPPPGYQGAHLDGNPGNNRVSNLMWKTVKANHANKIRHGTAQWGERNPRAILTEADVGKVIALKEQGLGPCEISRRLNRPLSTVHDIMTGKRWPHARARRALNPEGGEDDD